MNSDAFNVAFAKVMAKRNNPEVPEAKSSYFYKTPESPEPKSTIMAKAAYSREIHDRLNNIRR